MFGIKFENQNVENIKNSWALLAKKIVRRAFDLKKPESPNHIIKKLKLNNGDSFSRLENQTVEGSFVLNTENTIDYSNLQSIINRNADLINDSEI